MQAPRWIWILVVLAGVVFIFLEQGFTLSDIGILLVLIGGGKLLWDARRDRRE